MYKKGVGKKKQNEKEKNAAVEMARERYIFSTTILKIAWMWQQLTICFSIDRKLNKEKIATDVTLTFLAKASTAMKKKKKSYH